MTPKSCLLLIIMAKGECSNETGYFLNFKKLPFDERSILEEAVLVYHPS